MRPLVAEKGLDLVYAEGFKLEGDDLVEIDKCSTGGLCGVGRPFYKGLSLLAYYMGAFPVFVRDHRAKDHGRSFCLGVTSVFTHVPAEGVDELLFAVEPCG